MISSIPTTPTNARSSSWHFSDASLKIDFSPTRRVGSMILPVGNDVNLSADRRPRNCCFQKPLLGNHISKKAAMGKRRVSFNPLVRVRPSTSIVVDQEDFSELHMKPIDYKIARDNVRHTLALIKQGRLREENEEICLLGLEGYTATGAVVRRELRQAAFDAVLNMQSGYSSQIHKEKSAELVALVYKEYSDLAQAKPMVAPCDWPDTLKKCHKPI